MARAKKAKHTRARKVAEKEVDSMFEHVSLRPGAKQPCNPPKRQIVVTIPDNAPAGVGEAICTALENFLANGKALSTLILEHW